MSLSRGSQRRLPALLLNYYADLITTRADEEIRPSATGTPSCAASRSGGRAITPRELPAVSGRVQLRLRWLPAALSSRSLETALDALVFGEAAEEASCHRECLNVVAGGAATGAQLVSRPGVDKVSFTGSTVAGRIIG